MEDIGVIRGIFPLIGEYENNYMLQNIFEDLTGDQIKNICKNIKVSDDMILQIVEQFDNHCPLYALEDLRCLGLESGLLCIFEKPLLTINKTYTWGLTTSELFYFSTIDEVFIAFKEWCK